MAKESFKVKPQEINGTSCFDYRRRHTRFKAQRQAPEDHQQKMSTADPTSLETRPGIFFIGSSNVGKRTLLSRLLSLDFEDALDSPSQPLAHGWTINTKYYTADVAVWISHLHDDGISLASLPFYNRLTALVMVFDTSNLSSFTALKDWVSRNDIDKFDILLCVGNKVDRIPGHPVHAEYRRRLLNRKEADEDVFDEFVICETEGSSLLGDEEEASWEMKRACNEWCSELNIEYIEACASNADFDKCLSVDGDSQGVERLFGALSAHMWPGMILKSDNKLTGISIPEKEELSEEESDYEIEYEVLSAGSAEPWDDTYGGWVSSNGTSTTPDIRESLTLNNPVMENEHESGEKFKPEEMKPSTLMEELQVEKGADNNADKYGKNPEVDSVVPFEFEDLEQLMSEIGNVRDSLRLMPDSQRREMAANLAMKMASMFGGGSDDEEECN